MAVQRLTVAGRAYAVPADAAVRVRHHGAYEIAFVVGAQGAVGMIDARGPRHVPPQLVDAVLAQHFPRHSQRLLYRDEDA